MSNQNYYVQAIERAPPNDVDDVPQCWIEVKQSNELFIDDEEWEIDSTFLEALYQSVQSNSVLGVAAGDIEKHVALFLKDGIKTGKVRRKKD